jgi:hypothetical protein
MPSITHAVWLDFFNNTVLDPLPADGTGAEGDGLGHDADHNENHNTQQAYGGTVRYILSVWHPIGPN